MYKVCIEAKIFGEINEPTMQRWSLIMILVLNYTTLSRYNIVVNYKEKETHL